MEQIKHKILKIFLHFYFETFKECHDKHPCPMESSLTQIFRKPKFCMAKLLALPTSKSDCRQRVFQNSNIIAQNPMKSCDSNHPYETVGKYVKAPNYHHHHHLDVLPNSIYFIYPTTKFRACSYIRIYLFQLFSSHSKMSHIFYLFLDAIHTLLLTRKQPQHDAFLDTISFSVLELFVLSCIS